MNKYQIVLKLSDGKEFITISGFDYFEAMQHIARINRVAMLTNEGEYRFPDLSVRPWKPLTFRELLFYSKVTRWLKRKAK